VDQNPHINEFHPEPIRCAAHLCVSNESPEEAAGTVVWSLRRADGSVIREGRQEMTVAARTSRWLEEIEFPEADLTENYVSFAFLQEGRAVSGGTALFCAPKHFRFRNPGLTVRREGEELIVKAEAYAQSVQIQSEDPDLLLSDNFFSMDPGEKRVRILRGKAGKPRVRSVFDIA
jgi:beta-mannosidase